ncbi:MAG TPA: hypothetical protein PKB02_17645 [Anaerohalosphaeraceae bacterium]|nr:hypothetical protein [Anaerohalosphaeraceae bacterium]
MSANLHATLNGYVQPTIQAGLYESECNDGCPYGSASLNCGLSASIGANISACVELFGIGNCKDPSDHWTIGIEGNAYIDLAGEIKVNDCGTCGTTSNNLKITRLLAQIKATWMGIEIPINFPITE